MIKLLVYIKHHLSFVWSFVEWLNAIVFSFLYGHRLGENLNKLLEKYKGKFSYRLLGCNDMYALSDFFSKQPEEAFTFFKPHAFDVCSLKKKNRDHAFLMIGVFENKQLVGYCFLRCFFNKQAFRGKIVDVKYQGRGIAKEMGSLTTEISKLLGFRLFATISKDNVKSIASSKAVNKVRIVKELPNDYLYVEYLLKE